MNYIHNDVKLENICIGHERTDQLILIDFGLANKYLNSLRQHVKKE